MTHGLDAKQLEWAKKILHTVKIMDRFTTDEQERITDICFATVRVESNFKMYANRNNSASMRLPHDAVGSDHGSVGLYQQQVGGAPNSTADWGTTAQCMDVVHSTQKFVSTLENHTNWKNLSNGAAAQAVQGSAFPDRYAAEDDWAVSLRKELWPEDSKPKPQPAPHPAPHPAPAPPKHAAVNTYTVKSGDNLTKIAKAHHTTWQKIYRLNKAKIGGNPNNIKPGQELKLP